MTKNILTAAVFILLLGSVYGYSQDGPPGNEFAGDETDRPERAEILKRELRLTPEQMRQIRTLNVEMRPRMRDAQIAYRLARRDLDEAIYADDLNEEVLRSRLRAVNEAQAEVNRLRAFSEVSVRRILTPEQLVRFRELRQRFARQAERRMHHPDRPRDMRRMRKDVPDDPPARPARP